MTRKHTWLLAFCAAVAACETPTESTTPDVTLEASSPAHPRLERCDHNPPGLYHRHQLLGLQGGPAGEPELAQRRQLPQRPSLCLRRAEQHRRRDEDALLL